MIAEAESMGISDKNLKLSENVKQKVVEDQHKLLKIIKAGPGGTEQNNSEIEDTPTPQDEAKKRRKSVQFKI